MNPTIDHYILSSFKEYLDYRVLTDLAAYKNETLTLYPDTTDDRMAPKYGLYSSGRPQWVYDSAISAATIPTSVTHDGGTQNRGDDNMRIDFKNGRVILDKGTSLTNVSVDCATRYFNSYLGTDVDENLYLNTLFDRKPDFRQIDAHVKGDSFFGPCYFTKLFNTTNQGWEFGGADKSEYMIRAVILTRTEFEMIALAGVMRDMYLRCFNVLDSTPLNEFGDLKTVGWDYTTAAKGVTCHIEESKLIRIEPFGLAKQFSSIHPAVCNFKIFTTRNPRA